MPSSAGKKKLFSPRVALENFAASGPKDGRFRAGRTHHDWLYRSGAAGPAGRIHTSLSDRTERRTEHVLPGGGLDRRTHLRYRGFWFDHGAEHPDSRIRVEETARFQKFPQSVF